MDLVRYQDGTGTRSALIVSRGKKWMTVVMMEPPIALHKIALTEERWMSPIEYTGRRRKVANAFLAAGKRLGITASAKRALNGG